MGRSDMKQKILNALLIVTSLSAYLEWGGENSMFLFQGEIEVLTKLFREPSAAAHPFTLLPLLGQLILLFTIFQRTPAKILTLLGLVCLSFLLVFIFFIGVISLNYKIFISTLPFLIVGSMTAVEMRRQ